MRQKIHIDNVLHIAEIQTCRQKDDIASGRHNAEKAPFIEENQHKLMNSERGMISLNF